MRTTEYPLVSVLITAYNREGHLANAIQSVLESTYPNFEVIIVDDCSTDRSLAVAKEFELKDSRVKVYKNEKNLGDYANRNQVASYAKGKYLKYCDSDEELYPNCIGWFVESMEKYPDAALGLSQLPGNKRHPYELTPEEAYRHHYFDGGFFYNAPTSTLIRRKEFEEMGGFRNIRLRGDYDMWLRMGAKYNVVRLPAVVTHNYIHGDQENSLNLTYQKVLTHNLSMEALKSSECPLSEADRQEALKSWRSGYIKQHIFIGLAKFKFKEVAYLYKEAKISLGEVIAAIFS